MGKIKDSTIDTDEGDGDYFYGIPLAGWSETLTHTSDGVEGSSDYLHTLPDGLSIDTQKVCAHTDMIDYIGFNQKYKYCRTCDHKEYS